MTQIIFVSFQVYHKNICYKEIQQKWPKPTNSNTVLNPFWDGLFEPSDLWGKHDGPRHNVDIFAPMIMKFGTGIKLDIAYAMVIKKFVMSLFLRNYDIINCIFAYVYA